MTRVLVCYGSLHDGDSQQLARLAVDKIKQHAPLTQVELYEPQGLPLFDYVSYDHPKVVELFNLAAWCDGMIWCSPEYHGGPSGVMKNIIDWIPCRDRAEKVTRGKPLGVMSTCGGGQSFNTINSLVEYGRWLKMVTVPTHVNWNSTWMGVSEKVDSRVSDMVKEVVSFSHLHLK